MAFSDESRVAIVEGIDAQILRSDLPFNMMLNTMLTVKITRLKLEIINFN